MSNISIPENDNPIRTQAALGGNQKYRNMGNVSGQAYLVRGQVTHVYYQKGTLDFSPYGSGSGSSSETTDGSGSAPIPVDFWGTNTDGKVFGCYRPVKIGSQVLVAYINGDTSYPIVVGIYPDNEKGYELISPVPYNTGDDSTDSVQGDSLGEKKLYANQQLRYVSGKGDILKSMGGKSFLYISKNDSGYLDDINYAYDQISDFYDRDGNQINPTQTKAQSWLLVHEDNDSDENSDGHRTRFYLNKAGELMVAFMNKNDTSNITLLEASKDTGFKLTKRFDTSDLTEDSDTYVQLGIGNGNKVNITSVDSGDATTFDLENGAINFNTPEKGTISFNNVSVDSLLGKVSDAQNAANEASDKADNAYLAGETAKSAASDAAKQAIVASQAGEDAKSAAVDAKAAGEDAKAEAKDTQQRIIYYSSISNEKDVAIPGKYIIVNTDTYIKNGTIQTAHIADAAITMAKIANLAVGTAQIEDAAITQAKIGNLAVGTAQIEDAAITDAKVGTLSADHLNAGTIDFSVISGIHINASEIDVGKIVADQIYVNGLGDISKNLGTVTSGKITGTNINDDVDNVQSGVNDLNDPNLMNVIEKQTLSSQYAGLTSQYNVILARAKDDGISTTDLTTAYTNLDTFITPLLKDTTKASNIDRYTYNSLTYAYNTALSDVQAALKDAYNTDISNMQSSVSVASQAASSAAIVASQANETGNTASYVAAQASLEANQAKSAGDNATSVANNASQAASSAILAGSTATVNANKALTVASQAQIAGDNATSVANNASQAASSAILAGSTATVNANKALTVANEAKSSGDNATSVANNATSVANSARSVADSTYAYASSEISIQSTATAKAQSTADNAFSQAQAVGSQVSAEISSNSTATAKAQSTADNAFSQATTAIDNGKVTSQAVTDLQDGSKLTIADLENGLATKVANSDYASYKEQTASQIGQMVTNGAFSAYQQTTADLIASKVANSDFSAYQATTAKAISSKVESSDFNTYKTQTADLIDDKVANSDYASYKEQTASEIADRVSNSAFSTYQTQTASQIASKVDNGDFSTYKTQTADLISSKVATSDFSAYQSTTAKEISSKVESSDFNTYKTQTANMISSKVESSDFQALQTQVNNSAVGTNLLLNTSDYSNNWTWNVTPSIDTSQNPAILHYPSTTITSGMRAIAQQNIGTILQSSTTYTVSFYAKGSGTFIFYCYPGVAATVSSVNGVPTSTGSDTRTAIPLTSNYVRYTITFTTLSSISGSKNFLLRQDYNSSDTSYNTVEAYVYGMKLEKGSVATDWSLNPEDQATQSQITQLSDDINLRVTKGDLIDQINVQAGKTLISSSGQLILSGNSVVLDSVNPVVMKSANIGNLAVGTAQIANGAITNAQIGSLAVDTANIKDAAISSAKIANLAVGTAQIGNGAITTAKIGNLAVGTAQIANAAITDAQVGNVSANKLTAGTIDFNTITGKNINASNITTGTLSTDRLNVGTLSALSADLGKVTTGSLKGVDIVANSFSTPTGTFTTDASGAVVASNLTIRGVTNLVYNAALLGGNGSSIPGWNITNGYYSNSSLHDGVSSIGYNSSNSSWVRLAQSKMYALTGPVGTPFSASVWLRDWGSDSSMEFDFNLIFYDSNFNRVSTATIKYSGSSTGQDWVYKTIDNYVQPTNAVYVGIEYWASNGKGHASFSSPMLTQTTQSTGYQPDTGNVVSAGIINSSTINAGSIINDSNNTSNWYPFTVTPSGVASTTAFNSADALRTEMSGGGIRTMYRSVVSSGTQYEAYDGNFDGNMISLNSGFTNGKDMGFSQSVSGNQLTGQVTLSPLNGINLWGPTQSIHFSGLQMNGTGISFNSYGNIVADVGSTWWRVVDSSGNQVANFGTAPGNNTTFPKPIFVDQVGAYSTSNGGALLLCDYKGTSQISLRNDGNPQVVSASIYNRTYSSGSTVTVTSYGTLGRITSASKYKLDITKETSLSPANKLLSIDRSSWVDKESAERLADSKTNGTELSEPEINVSRHYGLIAEDLIKAGLDEFVIKGDNGQAEGIEYDRLWTVLIPKIRQLSNDNIQNKMTISKLESEIKELKQGR